MSMPTGSYSGGAGGAASTGPLTGGTSSADFSGFNVNFGSGTIESSRSDPSNMLPWLIGGGLALLLLVPMLRRR